MSTWLRGDLDGHLVEVEFDRSDITVSSATLHIDGDEIDGSHVWYGSHHLETTLEDGTHVYVAIGPEAAAERRRPQIRRGDGSWTDLTGS